MAIKDDLITDVDSTITTTWNIRDGRVVPGTDGITLNGGAVKLSAAYLYADLANSSLMAKTLDPRVTAKILKAFLSTSTRLIRHKGGTVVSFDGDRVLGIFVGDTKVTNAAECALKINWAVTNLIRPKFENKYSTVANAPFTISHGVGIDSGEVLIVRAGARNANDLISIGRGPNLAAKLSDIRDGKFRTFLTRSSYDVMMDSSKLSSDRRNMWTVGSYDYKGERVEIVKSGWTWVP
jgi:class 3 adenylate cyclase